MLGIKVEPDHLALQLRTESGGLACQGLLGGWQGWDFSKQALNNFLGRTVFTGHFAHTHSGLYRRAGEGLAIPQQCNACLWQRERDHRPRPQS